MDGASDAAKQVPQADPQPFGDLLDVDKGQVPHAALDSAVVGAVKPTSLRSFFLVDPLLFAQTADCAAKPDTDVERHCSQLSSCESDSYTADESHSPETVFAIPEVNLDQMRPCKRCKALMSIRMRARSALLRNPNQRRLGSRNLTFPAYHSLARSELIWRRRGATIPSSYHSVSVRPC